MNKTIGNMELTLNLVKSELGQGHYKETKTLMNTYRTLLSKFLSIPTSDNSIDEYEGRLVIQVEFLWQLQEITANATTTTLTNQKYREANDLAEVESRIEQCANNIEQMLKRRKQRLDRTNNLPQNKNN